MGKSTVGSEIEQKKKARLIDKADRDGKNVNQVLEDLIDQYLAEDREVDILDNSDKKEIKLFTLMDRLCEKIDQLLAGDGVSSFSDGAPGSKEPEGSGEISPPTPSGEDNPFIVEDEEEKPEQSNLEEEEPSDDEIIDKMSREVITKNGTDYYRIETAETSKIEDWERKQQVLLNKGYEWLAVIDGEVQVFRDDEI